MSQREAGRVKAPSHLGRWDPVGVGGQKESHIGFHSSISSHTSLPAPACPSHQQTLPARPSAVSLRSFPCMHCDHPHTSHLTSCLTTAKVSLFSAHTGLICSGHNTQSDPITMAPLSENPSVACPTQGKI